MKTTGLFFIRTLYLISIVLEAVQLNYPLELIFSIDSVFSLKYKKSNIPPMSVMTEFFLRYILLNKRSICILRYKTLREDDKNEDY